MNISDEEYEELESYFQLKLKDKEEQLRHARSKCGAKRKRRLFLRSRGRD